MDDIVRQAMAKWPHVPDCYGWLGLDARGHWHMRDDRAQALGAFTSGVPGAKGSMLRHDKLIDFIQRNYEADDRGCWYFQNGPQRVYVELEAAPWVWRIADDLSVRSQGGAAANVLRCLMDEHGRVFLHTDLGLGLVHTLDVGLAAQVIESGVWALEEMPFADMPSQFGFVLSPALLPNSAVSAAPT